METDDAESTARSLMEKFGVGSWTLMLRPSVMAYKLPLKTTPTCLDLGYSNGAGRTLILWRDLLLAETRTSLDLKVRHLIAHARADNGSQHDRTWLLLALDLDVDDADGYVRHDREALSLGRTSRKDVSSPPKS